jgi:hypothetical protein
MTLSKIIGFGLLSMVAMAAPVQAQIQVTGGTGFVEGAKIFVPSVGRTSDGQTDTRAMVYQGNFRENGLLIQTDRGNIPGENNGNVIFRASVFPTFDNIVDRVPDFTDKGSVLGTLSFRGYSATGERTLFTGIPTKLEFTLTGGSQTPFSQATPTTEYRTTGFLLTETGTATSPSSFAVVQRNTPIVFVQYQPGSNQCGCGATPPTDRQVSNLTVPASAYNITRSGLTYEGTLGLTLTGGTVDIPTPPGYSPTSNGSNSTSTATNNTDLSDSTNATFIKFFDYTTNEYQTQGFTIYQPTSSTDPTTPEQPNSNNQSTSDQEPVYIDTRTNILVVVVGLPSRVFPGLIGLQPVGKAEPPTSSADPNN